MYDYKVDYENNVNVGTASYSVTTRGSNLEGSLAGTFEIEKGNLAEASISWAEGVNDKYVQSGEAVTPEPQVSLGTVKSSDGWGEDAVYLPESDYGVVYYDADGVEVAAPTAAGTYTAQCVAASDNVEGVSPSVSFSILEEEISLQDAKIAPIGDQVATGKAIEPEVTVTLADGTVLEKDRDYTVEYADNVNVGTATVTVKGTGIYRGTLTANFDIAAQDISSWSQYDLSLSDCGQYNTYPHTGSEIKPAVVISHDDYVLVEGKDFTVEYANNVDVWKASNLGSEEGESFDEDKAPTVIVTGIGNFEGSKTITFSIMPAVDLSTATIDGLPSMTFNGSSQALHVNDAGRKYINLLPKYNMGAYGLQDGAGVLFEESYLDARDNEIAADEVVNAGDYTLVLTAKEGSGFTGSKQVRFSIAKADFSTVTVSDIESQVKYGSSVEPDPVITLGDYRLQKGTDYTLAYNGNTAESGYARVTITPTGNFSGDAVVKTFAYASASGLQEVNASLYKTDTDETSMAGGMVTSVRVGTADDNGKRDLLIAIDGGAGVTMDAIGVDGNEAMLVEEGLWKVSVDESALSGRVSMSFTYTVAAMGRSMTHSADLVLTTEASERASETIAALPEKPGAGDASAVKAAREAYDALQGLDKLLVSLDSVKVLEAAEQAVEAAVSQQESQNQGGSTSVGTGKSDQAAAGTSTVKTVSSVVVNTKKVTAASLKRAVVKAGTTTKSVKSIVFGPKVKTIKSGALKSFKNVKSITVKTKKLTKKSVKKALKGSKVKTVKVAVGSKKANKKFVKAYKKFFSKKNVERSVKVK